MEKITKEPFEFKLSKEETFDIVDRFVGFYENLNSIEDYFLARKKEKIANIKHEDFTKDLFTDYSIEPKDMNFVLEVIDGQVFNPSTQIIISLPLESQIGRQIMFGVRETTTNTYVGFIRMASPVLMIKPRNEFFGGVVRATQVNKSMINGSIIVPVQPFGYNYLGGKLLALICCSHEVRNILKEKYGEKIDTCFMETTSLYGDIKGVSQYDGLKPYIRYQSLTESDLFLFPIDEIYSPIRSKMRELYGKEEWGGNIVDPKGSGPKMREFTKCVSLLKTHLREYDMDRYKKFHDFTKSHMKAKTKKRFYYSDFGFDNVKEHINSDGEIPLREGQNFHKHNLDYMIEWWKGKSQKRYEKLKSEGRIRTDLEIYTLDSIDNGKIDMIR